MVTGKNGFGGYGDPTPFIHTADRTVKVYSDELKASNVDMLLTGHMATDEFVALKGKMDSDCEFVAAWAKECPAAYAALVPNKREFCAALAGNFGEWKKIASPDNSF